MLVRMGWNPWMTNSSPAEWSSGNAIMFNGGTTNRTNRQPQVFSLSSTNLAAGTNNVISWIDGFKENTTLDAARQAEIGNNVWITNSGGTEYWNGLISEAIAYYRQLSDAEMGAVNTYLAIKYGIRLDQRTATNYVLNDGTVIWDATINSTYKYHIAGIGRQDESALLQKQSSSVHAGMQLVIGLGSIADNNAANANTYSNDLSYLVWGDDSASVTFKTTIAGNALFNYRMARVWKVQETGTIGSVKIAAPYDALPNPSQSYLVVSADATFDGTDTYIPLYDITINGKRYWAAKTDLTDGQYFTIAAFIKSPGSVGMTSLWMRADKGIQDNTDGTDVDVWVDYGNRSEQCQSGNCCQSTQNSRILQQTISILILL